MSAPTPDHWQIQEAKQRFSEVIRVVTTDGPADHYPARGGCGGDYGYRLNGTG